jgi:1-acyl-sn-glycerol-3-phosphate acyltransferase
MLVVLPLVVVNTLVHCVPLLAVAVFKAIFPSERLRVACNPILTGLAESWIGVNSALIAAFTGTRFEVSGDASLQRDGHYLVMANHQSWVDILVLQQVFNRRMPLLRFFLKRQLFWVPVLGLAWWALDFPFMGRYTRKEIARNPELGRRDREVTRKACEKFSAIPVSVMNFVEGTRFTAEKHAVQKSPYQHLLKPKSGGVAFVLDAMGQGLHSIVDVTIVYPAGRPSMVDLIGNRVPLVQVLVRQRPIPAELVGGNYEEDREFRATFQRWMNGLWQEKDADITALLSQDAACNSGADKR